MNRSPRPSEGYPLPPYPWLALTTAAAVPLLVLVVGLNTDAFWAFVIPVAAGVSVPGGLVVLVVTAFPLMMPADVRYLAAVVSTVLLGALTLLWIMDIGLTLVPVVILLFFVWAANHPTLIRDVENSARAEDTGGVEDTGDSEDTGKRPRE